PGRAHVLRSRLHSQVHRAQLAAQAPHRPEPRQPAQPDREPGQPVPADQHARRRRSLRDVSVRRARPRGRLEAARICTAMFHGSPQHQGEPPMTRPMVLMTLAAVVLAASAATLPFAATASEDEHGRYKHVLLISVDGLHEVDLVKYVQSHPRSTMADLLEHGVHYTNASTSKPSDSFPGLTALVTSAPPERAGVSSAACCGGKRSRAGDVACATIGTETMYAENLDTSFDDALGGATKLITTIAPKRLPRDAQSGCGPVYPHQFLRVNTIF